ncbi:hypothetical protein M8818_002198 [Zalaria obscura]|uniref:Uncharacterized protein n=1 Tax=Zalaria obscura TaxID=2024903 RepID=A0ACC3SI49_9PEZI
MDEAKAILEIRRILNSSPAPTARAMLKYLDSMAHHKGDTEACGLLRRRESYDCMIRKDKKALSKAKCLMKKTLRYKDAPQAERLRILEERYEDTCETRIKKWTHHSCWYDETGNELHSGFNDLLAKLDMATKEDQRLKKAGIITQEEDGDDKEEPNAFRAPSAIKTEEVPSTCETSSLAAAIKTKDHLPDDQDMEDVRQPSVCTGPAYQSIYPITLPISMPSFGTSQCTGPAYAITDELYAIAGVAMGGVQASGMNEDRCNSSAPTPDFKAEDRKRKASSTLDGYLQTEKRLRK